MSYPARAEGLGKYGMYIYKNQNWESIDTGKKLTVTKQFLCDKFPFIYSFLGHDEKGDLVYTVWLFTQLYIF